ncbi:MAG TPA: SRPBCC domain-containing protein [Candidatus Binataceae bacterium]|nr:SRPBCC domain-containing protein [Candidatus Binataceae bacterium]
MAATSNAAAIPAERELVITRIFDAPRKVVYQAWADPEQMVKWLGPKGFTGKIIKMDARPGGAYRFYMRDPEGGDHWQQGVFREIVEGERIVQTYAWADADGNPTRPETLLTVTFEDHGAKTKLTLHQAVFESVTARDMHRGGWTSALDRLEEVLAQA